MKANVLPGVLLRKDIKPGKAAVASLLTASEPGSQMVVELEKDGDVEVDAGGKDEDLVGFDLTFEGAYKAGDSYVVHAAKKLVLPKGSPLEKKGKDNKDKEEKKKAKKDKEDKKDKKAEDEGEEEEDGARDEEKKDKKDK
jgi:hypothetical protein